MMRKRVRTLVVAGGCLLLVLGTLLYPTQMTDLPTPQLEDLGPAGPGLIRINNAGIMVGNSTEDSAWIANVATSRDRVTLSQIARAKGITNSGTVLGNVFLDGLERTVTVDLTAGATAVLDHLPNRYVVLNICDDGQMVGFFADEKGRTHGFRWTRSDGIVNLTEETGEKITFAYACNSRGQIAGQFIRDGDAHAFIWDHSAGLVDLHPSEAETSCAYGLNNSSDVVGYYQTDGAFRAFYWSKETGLLDLNDLAPPPATNLVLASDLNDHGDVVGLSMSNGQFRIFSLHLPKGEPQQQRPHFGLARKFLPKQKTPKPDVMGGSISSEFF